MTSNRDNYHSGIEIWCIDISNHYHLVCGPQLPYKLIAQTSFPFTVQKHCDLPTSLRGVYSLKLVAVFLEEFFYLRGSRFNYFLRYFQIIQLLRSGAAFLSLHFKQSRIDLKFEDLLSCLTDLIFKTVQLLAQREVKMGCRERLSIYSYQWLRRQWRPRACRGRFGRRDGRGRWFRYSTT